MKKIFYAFIFLSFCYSTTLFSQSCFPDGITFITQEQIDNFPSDYPNCTEIEGNVTISGANITNLDGLNVLTSIDGYLSIWENIALTNISGLNNLTSAGHIDIWENSNLINLTGLNNLISIEGSLFVSFNELLSSLTGIDHLSFVGEFLEIANNQALTNLTGLGNLTTIGLDLIVAHNQSLSSLVGLENLTSIGGNLWLIENNSLTNITALHNLNSINSWLNIRSNNSLTSLDGLENIDSESIDALTIYSNVLLSFCEVQSICEYLVNANGIVEIHDNATGCNSQQEVEGACASSINEYGIIYEITTTPNPFTSSTILSYEVKQPERVTLSIYNHLGQLTYQEEENQTQGKQQLIWNAEMFVDGIYYYRLQVGDAVANGRMVKVR